MEEIEKEKRPFSDEEDCDIYLATYRIKTFLFMHAGGHVMKSSTSKPKAISKVTELAIGSTIHALIEQRDWENLFKNNCWLDSLESAQNLNFLVPSKNSISNELRIIAKYFPIETEQFIIVDMLQ
jgi:hypothetical protein